jgi:hypothetical protein
MKKKDNDERLWALPLSIFYFRQFKTLENYNLSLLKYLEIQTTY